MKPSFQLTSTAKTSSEQCIPVHGGELSKSCNFPHAKPRFSPKFVQILAFASHFWIRFSFAFEDSLPFRLKRMQSEDQMDAGERRADF